MEPGVPRFSIIIPCCNAMAFVVQSVESCLAQTETDLEVIVVDDGSTDGSVEVLKPLLIDPRLQIVQQGNQGVGAARNAGLAVSRGEFINFVDADDLLDAHKLAVQGQVLAENEDVDFVLCDGRQIDQSGVVVDEHLVDKRRLLGRPNLFDLLFCGGLFPPLVPLVRRRILVDIGGFSMERERGGWADSEIWMRLALAGKRYHFVEQSLCSYRRYAGNMSSDAGAMDVAAASVYAALMREQPERSACALRFVQNRLIDLELAVSAMRGAVYEAQGAAYDAEMQRQCLAMQLAPVKKYLADRGLDINRIAADELQQQLNRLIDETDGEDARKLVIWGAGGGGQRMLEVLRHIGGDAVAFVDADVAKVDSVLSGVPVRAPVDLLEEALRGAFVLVASVHAPAIMRQLHHMGLEADRDAMAIDFNALAMLEKRAGSE